ncbi:MAG: hypothetical protein AB7J35_13670 [Dehalococcoidia bacterium]
MADLRLAATQHVSVAASSVAADGRGHHGAYQQPKRKRTARERLVAMLAPNREPESCEVDYVVDAQGMMVAVLVRDILNGELIARINAEDLSQLSPDEAAGGILLERRG